VYPLLGRPVQNDDCAPSRRRKNRLPETGAPGSVVSNEPGTTIRIYGPDGKPLKDFNQGHEGANTPEAEQQDHVHDYVANPHNPAGRPDRKWRRFPLFTMALGREISYWT